MIKIDASLNLLFLQGLIAYTQYSIQQFMIKMANISHMDTLLINEMAAEQAGYLLLQGQSVLIQQTINYLVTRLAKEVHDRTIMYELNKEWLDALSVNVSGVLMAINTQTEINHNLDVVSTNGLTTISTSQASERRRALFFSPLTFRVSFSGLDDIQGKWHPDSQLSVCRFSRGRLGPISRIGHLIEFAGAQHVADIQPRGTHH